MGHEVQRKIERSDSHDRAYREAAHYSPAAGGVLLPVKRQVFAINARTFLGGNGESKNRPIDFRSCRFDGLACLLGKGVRKLFFFCAMLEDIWRRTRCRSNAGKRRVVPNAFTEAAMARSACSRLP